MHSASISMFHRMSWWIINFGMFLSVPWQILFVGVFVWALAPLCVWFAVFVFDETQIWLGDLRVVLVSCVVFGLL